MDDVKVALGNKGMTVEAERQCVKDLKEWRALVRMYMIAFHAAIFARSGVLSDRAPVLWWLSPGFEQIEGWVRCCYMMRLG